MGEDLKAAFEQAQQDVKQLPRRPSDDEMLKLYALFKQATSGDVQGKRPGFTDPVGRAKYDAWSKLSGTSTEDAEQQYIALVNSL